MTNQDRRLDGLPGGPSPIVLPRWFARVAASGPEPPHVTSGNVLCADRVTVFEPDASARTLRFGPDRRSLALFEGYLFDRGSLAGELDLPPEEATEVRILAAAYGRWGAGLFDRLDGAYLALIWDAPNELLLAGRDALGLHPLYWATTGANLWIASNILALAESGQVPRRPDRASLALRLLLKWPRAGETFFADIHRLRPGHLLRRAGSGAPHELRFWDPVPADDEPWIDDDVVREEFEPRLARAVDRCLQLEPQGVMLSGGVDSVTIAAIAVDEARKRGLGPLAAISATAPPGYEIDAGAPYQRPVAERLGMPHLVTDARDWIGDRDWWEVYVQELVQLPSPTLVWWTGEFMGFYRWTGRQGMRTLLTGSGGDDWLVVPYIYLADLVRGLRLGMLARFARAERSTGSGSAASLLSGFWQQGLLPFANAVWEKTAPASRARRHRRSWLGRLPDWWCPDGELLEEVLAYLESLRLPGLDADRRLPRSQYRHAIRHRLRNPFGSYELERGFHENCLAGLRLVAPFHDRRMAEFYFRMSPGVRLTGGRSKGLLRPIVARRLPGLGLERQRKEYPSPEKSLPQLSLRHHLPQAWSKLDFGRLGELGVVDTARLPRELDGREARSDDELVRLATIPTCALWLDARKL